MGDRWIVCAEAASGVPGSLPTLCTKCGTRLFISPTGQRLALTRNLKPICVTCMVPGGIIMPLEPEQVAEIRAHLQ